jgi:hypothetical protein
LVSLCSETFPWLKQQPTMLAWLPHRTQKSIPLQLQLLFQLFQLQLMFQLFQLQLMFQLQLFQDAINSSLRGVTCDPYHISTHATRCCCC